MTEHSANPYGAGASGPTGPIPTGPIPADSGPTNSAPADQGSTSRGTASQAKDEARNVADTATSAGADVAHTAKEQAAQVASETKQQAASLLDTVRSEVGQQAGTQQQRIAEAVHSLSQELGSMASSSSESGPLTDLVQQASHRGGELAHWLQDREPSDVLDAVRSYARRRPGTFLALCALGGVLAGRLTRSTVATRTSLDSPGQEDRHVGDGQERSFSEPGAAAGNGYLESTPVNRPAFAAPAADPARSLGTVATETRTVSAPGTGSDPLAPGSEPLR